MKIKIKKLHPEAIIPKYEHEGDAGFDLYATEDVIIQPGETKLIPTGLAVELPRGYELQIRPRSGITKNTKLRIQLGTVDAGYTGEIHIIVDNIAQNVSNLTDRFIYSIKGGHIKQNKLYPKGTYIIRKGNKIAQGVIAPVSTVKFEEVDELNKTSRGNKGFGSTGV